MGGGGGTSYDANLYAIYARKISFGHRAAITIIRWQPMGISKFLVSLKRAFMDNVNS